MEEFRHAIDTPEDSSHLDPIQDHLGTDEFSQDNLNHIKYQNPRPD